MNACIRRTGGALAALFVYIGSANAQPAPPPPPFRGDPGAEGVEVLTRGPVHEAFAQPVVFDPEPGMLSPEAPPELIEELPPDQRPDGDNVVWIPGYWGWDGERTDFIWISGLWRDMPPGREWLPGYWNRTASGHQWVAGYWNSNAAQDREIEYLPPPPPSVEAGPPGEQLDDNQSWVPGNWYWQDRYVWRPGFWMTEQADWVWIPAHYVWTPGGHVYVEGYWDYEVEDRGLLCAPVYFDRRVNSRPRYTPSVFIDVTVMLSHFFARPTYSHYYFGDYYEQRNFSSGIIPWFSYHNSRYGYDPIYARSSYRHRDDGNWYSNLRRDYIDRRGNADRRPPRTYSSQQTYITRTNINQTTINNISIGKTGSQYAASRGGRNRLVNVDAGRRTEIVRQNAEVRRTADVRRRVEANTPDRDQPREKAVRREAVRSPYVGNRVATPATRTAPRRPEVSRPDPTVARPPVGKARRPDPNPDRDDDRARPGTKRRPNVDPRGKDRDEPKGRDRDPEPKRKSEPEPKRKSDPEPKRKDRDEPRGKDRDEPRGKDRDEPKGKKPKSEP